MFLVLKDKYWIEGENGDEGLYYFDRHRQAFTGILYFYQSTRLDDSGEPIFGSQHILRPLHVPMGIEFRISYH